MEAKITKKTYMNHTSHQVFYHNLPNIVWVFVCVSVWLMKSSISFDPNNAKFAQKIKDSMGRVINVIRPKTVQKLI